MPHKSSQRQFMALMFIVRSAAVNSSDDYVKIVSLYIVLLFFRIFWSRGAVYILEKSLKKTLPWLIISQWS